MYGDQFRDCMWIFGLKGLITLHMYKCANNYDLICM